jgi:hypothetical protein
MERVVDPIQSKKLKIDLGTGLNKKIEYIKTAKSRRENHGNYNMHGLKDIDTLTFEISSHLSTTRDELKNTISSWKPTYTYREYSAS